MIDSRCGLLCTGCAWKASHGCGGCIETNGQPFHGACSIANCCQEKGLAHCGECDIIPCDKLYAYSYLDPEHGDNPLGARVGVCRRWAAEAGKQAWGNVLLTSAGLLDSDGQPWPNIVNCFLAMLDQPVSETRVLLIPGNITPMQTEQRRNELMHLGITASNIQVAAIDDLDENTAMTYDVLYLIDSEADQLLQRMKAAGFDAIVKKMVYAGKVYVGVSAGSVIATPNIAEPFAPSSAGLALVNAYLAVHCSVDQAARTDLPLPHIPLADNQAIAVSWSGYTLVQG